MSGSPRIVWLQREGGGGELAEAREAVERLLQEERMKLTRCEAVEQAEQLLRGGPVKLLLLAEPRRGGWSQDDCERLHAAGPLTMLVGVHGSWCEGWQRSGHPWRGVEHCYWHQLPGRLPHLLARGHAVRTQQLDERLRHTTRRPEEGGRAAISAAGETAEALADAIAACGWTTCERDERCDAALWDGDPRRAIDLQRLAQLAESLPDTPRLAILAAPRVDDWRQALQYADWVISKPFLLSDLEAWLTRSLRDQNPPGWTGDDQRHGVKVP